MNFNEEYYKRIAEELVNVVPEKWERIYFRAEVGDESVSMYFYYRLIGSSEYEQGANLKRKYNLDRDVYSKFVSDICSIVQELNDDYVKNKQEKWTAMTYFINSNFNFTVDYEYFDLGSSLKMERREIWKEKYLK